MTSAGGGIAYWAHIGGFLAGLLVGPLLVRSEQRYRPYYADEGIYGFNPMGRRQSGRAKEEIMHSPISLALLRVFGPATGPRQRMLDAMRTRKIAHLERSRNSWVIPLVHGQETMRLLGFPSARYIDVNDSQTVLRAIEMTDDYVPRDMVLHMLGGLVLAALQIVQAIRDHKSKVTAFVPHYATSGGTLISLAADEIIMRKHSVLGPIDPQLGDLPAASLIRSWNRSRWPRSTIRP